MPLRCPFCGATEDERVEGKDDSGRKVLLVMFDCPVYYRFYENEIGEDARMQEALDRWRRDEGDDWLQSLGQAMMNRELRNIERNKK